MIVVTLVIVHEGVVEHTSVHADYYTAAAQLMTLVEDRVEGFTRTGNVNADFDRLNTEHQDDHPNTEWYTENHEITGEMQIIRDARHAMKAAKHLLANYSSLAVEDLEDRLRQLAEATGDDYDTLPPEDDDPGADEIMNLAEGICDRDQHIANLHDAAERVITAWRDGGNLAGSIVDNMAWLESLLPDRDDLPPPPPAPPAREGDCIRFNTDTTRPTAGQFALVKEVRASDTRPGTVHVRALCMDGFERWHTEGEYTITARAEART